ncbi:MAG: ribonuclease III [Clostridia bacterium]|nr:ribonuclease III [Clostridia bacterium]
MSIGKDISLLETSIGYCFRDKSLLETALTHSSFINECKGKLSGSCNERMEFLGDSVLQIIVSDLLYSVIPIMEEGEMTTVRQHLVCEETLSRWASQICLGDYLRLGKGEEQSGGRTQPSILADAFEALLSAVYLDSGRETAFLFSFLGGMMKEEMKKCDRGHGGDYKTRLQQLVQQDGNERLCYTVVSESGPDHAKVFEVCAMLNSNPIGHGFGKSKREAEQHAAKEALTLFGVTD